MSVIRVLHSLRTWLALTENWVHEQIIRLPESVENIVVADEKGGSPPALMSPVHIAAVEWPLLWKLEKNALALLPWRRAMFKSVIARRYRPDIIHSHFGTVGWQDRPVAYGVRAVHIVTFYGIDVNYVPRVDRRWVTRYQDLFGSAALILCEGPHMRRELIELGASERLVKVHHLGVDVESIPFRPKVWERESLHVAIASSFRPKKGIPIALEALARLQREIPVEVTLIGDAGADEIGRREKQAIMDIIQKHDMKVEFRGFVPLPEMRRLVQSADIFVAASHRAPNGDTEGGAPVVLLEVAALGVPIVSTKHCDIPEVILHGQTGLLANEGSVDSMFQALRQMVDRSGEWPGFVKSGRIRIEQEFNSRLQAMKLADFYADAIR